MKSTEVLRIWALALALAAPAFVIAVFADSHLASAYLIGVGVTWIICFRSNNGERND